MNRLEIGLEPLKIEEVFATIKSEHKIELSESARQRVRDCREYLEAKVSNSDSTFYGINTGFGALCSVKISPDDLAQLQYNLITSHACGVGEPISSEVARLMLLLKSKGLALGHSGVREEIIDRLIDFYNSGTTPIVPRYGSLGASGDLAPLGHLCLPIIGLGEMVDREGRALSSKDVELIVGPPIQLGMKEGLAMLNGTQFMSAFGVWCVGHAKRLVQISHVIAALSIEGWMGRIDAFAAQIHLIRNSPGQIESARLIRELLEGSELQSIKRDQVQDPYSFRCIPQVHGASMNTIDWVYGQVENEINAVTDNPLIFPESDLIVSGGNFHGQPIAIALDCLAIALAELGNISERRTYNLISGKQGLPPFLTSNPGLNSGFMIPQYTAAALVNRNKTLANPSSTDSIVSSNGQEDHVSMGANSAVKCYELVENLYSILAIEMMAAAQSIEFRRPGRSSNRLEEILYEYRSIVPPVTSDRVLKPDIDSTVHFLKNLELK